MRWFSLIFCLVFLMPIKAESSDQEKLTKFVKNRGQLARLPDVAVVVMDKDQQHFVFNGGETLNGSAIFEIGSNSKAFTGVGIQLLIQQNKLSAETYLVDILPNFSMTYKGKKAALQIKHLLFQTSGLPFKSIEKVNLCQPDSDVGFLVEQLNGTKLDFVPGQRFSYATANYDILGLIIEKVSGMSYHAFIERNIFKPLEMDSTYIPRPGHRHPGNKKVTGHKLGFGQAHPFDAQVYPCHGPAAYIH